MITKAALVSALADDRSQEMSEFQEARSHLFKTLLEDAAENPAFDLFGAELTIAKLFSPSPSDITEAIEKLRAVRKTCFG